jgi:hypothetical protein
MIPDKVSHKPELFPLNIVSSYSGFVLIESENPDPFTSLK